MTGLAVASNEVVKKLSHNGVIRDISDHDTTPWFQYPPHFSEQCALVLYMVGAGDGQNAVDAGIFQREAVVIKANRVLVLMELYPACYGISFINLFEYNLVAAVAFLSGR